MIRSHHLRAHAHCLRRAEDSRSEGKRHARYMDLARRSRLALSQSNYVGAERRKEAKEKSE